jgi:hypothetical protein
MSIKIYSAPVTSAEALLKKLLIEQFHQPESFAQSLARGPILQHLGKLKDSCYLVAESPYVDKVYRDSYYHYYSSKQNKYDRDCIRLSIFDEPIELTDFRDPARIEVITKKYLGFIVLRPTTPKIIGRSTISPKALKDNTFLCCYTTVHSTVNSIKMKVDGFPHSSQDTETISCAETTLWALMEYFGTKYPEYKPTLPSKIISALSKVSTERQVPTKGLNVEQMSYALKEFGFGTRVYSERVYKQNFKKLFSTYIESGIPLIIDLNNFATNGGIGHASICIGHEDIIDHKLIDQIPENNNLHEDIVNDVKTKGLKIFDWDDIDKEYVFIDDNFPCYQKALFDKPAIHYPTRWHDCKIKHFIVPLYPKIYLEAYEAKNYVLKFLTKLPNVVSNNKEVLIRFFLTSSRSYKDRLALNSSFDQTTKDFILETPMAKFIWVAELSTKDLIKEKKADGLILVDATEANISFHKALIMSAYGGKYRTTSKLSGIDISLPPFIIYENNLKNL